MIYDILRMFIERYHAKKQRNYKVDTTEQLTDNWSWKWEWRADTNDYIHHASPSLLLGEGVNDTTILLLQYCKTRLCVTSMGS
jgi:hypothetical protein